MSDYILAGTGSRSLQSASPTAKLNAWNDTKLFLASKKEYHGDSLVVMSGMAEGFDKCLALAALALGIRLHVAIPNRGYANYYWGKKSLTGNSMLTLFNLILTKAEKVVYVMEDIHNSNQLYLEGRHSNFLRNDYMVQQAHEFVVWNPTSPGTRDCLATIKQSGKPFTILAEG